MRNELERLGLIKMEFPAEVAKVAHDQIRPIVEYHVRHFSAYLSGREQLERIAFDCYTQGLIHGNQIPKVQS